MGKGLRGNIRVSGGLGPGEAWQAGTQREPGPGEEECFPHPRSAATLSSWLPMFREGYGAGPWDQSEFTLFTSIYPGPEEGPSHRGVPVPAGVQSPPGGNKGNRREQSWGRRRGSGFLRSCLCRDKTQLLCFLLKSHSVCKRGSAGAHQGQVTQTGTALGASGRWFSGQGWGALWGKGKCWMRAPSWPETLGGSYFYLVKA